MKDDEEANFYRKLLLIAYLITFIYLLMKRFEII